MACQNFLEKIIFVLPYCRVWHIFLNLKSNFAAWFWTHLALNLCEKKCLQNLFIYFNLPKIVSPCGVPKSLLIILTTLRSWVSKCVKWVSNCVKWIFWTIQLTLRSHRRSLCLSDNVVGFVSIQNMIENIKKNQEIQRFESTK